MAYNCVVSFVVSIKVVALNAMKFSFEIAPRKIHSNENAQASVVQIEKFVV